VTVLKNCFMKQFFGIDPVHQQGHSFACLNMRQLAAKEGHPWDLVSQAKVAPA
jgi:hypothetical protein